jgi:hypothetical protein
MVPRFCAPNIDFITKPSWSIPSPDRNRHTSFAHGGGKQQAHFLAITPVELRGANGKQQVKCIQE